MMPVGGGGGGGEGGIIEFYRLGYWVKILLTGSTGHGTEQDYVS